MLTPPPPSITPQQMNLLRIVTAMAWADGQLEPDEVKLMLQKLSGLFAVTQAHQDQLCAELEHYMAQKIPLEEVIPKLEAVSERELVLKLAYEVIYCSSRNPDEPRINMDEAQAYQRLVKLLALPNETVVRLEQEAIQEVENSPEIVDTVAKTMELYFRGH